MEHAVFHAFTAPLPWLAVIPLAVVFGLAAGAICFGTTWAASRYLGWWADGGPKE